MESKDRIKIIRDLEKNLNYKRFIHTLGVAYTATSLAMDNHMPVIVFALKDPENIYRVVMGEQLGTLVKED